MHICRRSLRGERGLKSVVPLEEYQKRGRSLRGEHGLKFKKCFEMGVMNSRSL